MYLNMVKIKKRVALNKISHFFKSNPLVIFFHCSNRTYFQEKIRKLVEIKKSLLSSKVVHAHGSEGAMQRNSQNLDFISNKNSINDDDLMIRLVKNNYAKKALLEFNGLTKNNTSCLSILGSKETVFDGKPCTFLVENKDLNNKNKKEKRFGRKTNHKILGSSLLQGSNLLIGFKNIRFLNTLNLIKEFIDDENVEVLGGIYENSVVDHNQIKRLAEISGDKQIYKDLNNQLQNNTFKLMCELTKLNFDFLLHPHYKIIALLKLLDCKLK